MYTIKRVKPTNGVKRILNIIPDNIEDCKREFNSDILKLMLRHVSYEDAMKCSSTKQPRVFESITIILGITKLLDFIGKPQDGKYMEDTLTNMTDTRRILSTNISQGGDKSDITFMDENNIYPVSVKYGETIVPDSTEIDKLLGTKLYPNKIIKPFLLVRKK